MDFKRKIKARAEDITKFDFGYYPFKNFPPVPSHHYKSQR